MNERVMRVRWLDAKGTAHWADVRYLRFHQAELLAVFITADNTRHHVPVGNMIDAYWFNS